MHDYHPIVIVCEEPLFSGTSMKYLSHTGTNLHTKVHLPKVKEIAPRAKARHVSISFCGCMGCSLLLLLCENEQGIQNSIE